MHYAIGIMFHMSTAVIVVEFYIRAALHTFPVTDQTMLEEVRIMFNLQAVSQTMPIQDIGS